MFIVFHWFENTKEDKLHSTKKDEKDESCGGLRV